MEENYRVVGISLRLFLSLSLFLARALVSQLFSLHPPMHGESSYTYIARCSVYVVTLSFLCFIESALSRTAVEREPNFGTELLLVRKHEWCPSVIGT